MDNTNTNTKPHIDTSQVAISVSIDTPKTATLSPLPNVPTFIKLFGKPEGKEEKDKENDDWDDTVDGEKKSDVLDIIDASDEGNSFLIIINVFFFFFY